MIPLPGIIFNSIAFPLQLLAAQVASVVLETCAVPVFREGNVMHLAAASLDVEEACSGIRSLLSLTALGVLYSYLTYSTWMPRAAVDVRRRADCRSRQTSFACRSPGLLAHYLSVDTALGVFHTAGGWSVFLVAAALLLGVSGLLRVVGWRNDRTHARRRRDAAALVLGGAGRRPRRPGACCASRSAHFPDRLGAWRGEDLRFSARIENKLGVADYVSKFYRAAVGSGPSPLRRLLLVAAAWRDDPLAQELPARQRLVHRQARHDGRRTSHPTSRSR